MRAYRLFQQRHTNAQIFTPHPVTTSERRKQTDLARPTPLSVFLFWPPSSVERNATTAASAAPPAAGAAAAAQQYKRAQQSVRKKQLGGNRPSPNLPALHLPHFSEFCPLHRSPFTTLIWCLYMLCCSSDTTSKPMPNFVGLLFE